MPQNEEKRILGLVPSGALDKGVKPLPEFDRRRFLRNGMSLGGLTLLTGCEISDTDQVQKMFAYFSRWNNLVQQELFSGIKLAPEYPESMAVKEFRYNAWYHPPLAPVIRAAEYRLELAGLISDKRPWTVPQLYALPQKARSPVMFASKGGA